MFNVSIRDYFSVLNVFVVCIRNTAMFKLIPLLCTHVYSYMFSTVHPPSFTVELKIIDIIDYRTQDWLSLIIQKIEMQRIFQYVH